jgi:hypothetical protein
VHYSTSDSPTSTDDRSCTCPRCGTIDTPSVGPGKGPHVASALCRHCGAFVQWLSQYPPAERQARRQQARDEAMARKPPSDMQLAYLAALGHSGPPPVHMLAASRLIDSLTRKEVQR